MKLNRNLYLQYDRLVDNTMNTLHKRKQSVELCIQTWEIFSVILMLPQ